MPDFDSVEHRPVVHVVAVIEIDRLFYGASLHPSQAADGLREVPVGFKWFVAGLFDGSYCFGGEESAGASFLRLDGTVWTTDKDGPIMDLLAAGAVTEARAIQPDACNAWRATRQTSALTGKFWALNVEIDLDTLCGSR